MLYRADSGDQIPITDLFLLVLNKQLLKFLVCCHLALNLKSYNLILICLLALLIDTCHYLVPAFLMMRLVTFFPYRFIRSGYGLGRRSNDNSQDTEKQEFSHPFILPYPPFMSRLLRRNDISLHRALSSPHIQDISLYCLYFQVSFPFPGNVKLQRQLNIQPSFLLQRLL